VGGRCHDVVVAPTSEEFRAAWPRIVRVLAAWTGSLDDAEEYAAEAVSRAVTQQGVDDLAAWCVSVAKRAWIDDHRRRDVLARRLPELAPDESTTAMDPHHPDHPDQLPEGLDDRLALLFVACDDVLGAAASMVLALRVVCGLSVAEIADHLGIEPTTAAARLTRAKKSLASARGEFRVPPTSEQVVRLPVVLDCVAGMFTVAHRFGFDPPDALADTGAQSLSIADALVATFPAHTEVRGLRAVIRLGLARRPGRVDEQGVALTLDEMDRSRWDQRLLRAGLEDATYAAAGDGRFAVESAISGLHSVAPTFADTDWPRIADLYGALERRWPSPAVHVAMLVARAQAARSSEDLAAIERDLERTAELGPSYARRDALFALADLRWRSGRTQPAAALYAELLTTVTSEPVRRFCLRRMG
jgi:RNA polymerase sigma factor (sigma-70 family)